MKWDHRVSTLWDQLKTIDSNLQMSEMMLIKGRPTGDESPDWGTKQHMVTNVFMVLLLDGNSILDAWETGYMPCVRESIVYNLPLSFFLSS